MDQYTPSTPMTDDTSKMTSSPSTGTSSGSLGEKTRRAAAQAQQKAGEQVKSGIDTGKQRAAGALHGVADSLLHGTGDHPAEGATRYIQQAGEQMRRAADWLENTNVEELTERTEEFARRQPALFIGGAFALGLVAARFLKSSSRNHQERHPATSGYGDAASTSTSQVYRDGGL